MTFTLDHPHGYKLAREAESEARIVSTAGGNPNHPVIMEFRYGPSQPWLLLYVDKNGESDGGYYRFINAPAPKRKVYVALVVPLYSKCMESIHGQDKSVVEKHPLRISPVVEVEIDV